MHRPVAPVVIRYGDKTLVTYALLDTGSDRCAVLPSIAERLDMKIVTSPMVLMVFDKRMVADRDQVSFSVESLDGDCLVKVNKALLCDTFATKNDRAPCNHDIEDLDYMEGQVSFVELETEEIGLLLSVEQSWTWMLGEALAGREDQPIAVNTHFGWCIMGPCKKGVDEEMEEASMHCCMVENGQSALEEEIRKVLRYDFTMREGEKAHPEETHPSVEDSQMIKMVEDSLVFDEKLGHYRCELPWKNGREEAAKKFNVPAFEAQARKRRWSARNRMLKEPLKRLMESLLMAMLTR